jgi:ketosteroid isomerase-like protein
MQTYDAMMRFAEAWIAAWNRRDVDAVLTHYAEDL